MFKLLLTFISLLVYSATGHAQIDPDLTRCYVQVPVCETEKKCKMVRINDKWENLCSEEKDCEVETVAKWCDIFQRKFNDRNHWLRNREIRKKCWYYARAAKQAKKLADFWGPSNQASRAAYKRQERRFRKEAQRYCNMIYPSVQPSLSDLEPIQK